MKLSEMFLQSKVSGAETKTQKKSSTGSGFEMLMNTADKAAEKTASQFAKFGNSTKTNNNNSANKNDKWQTQKTSNTDYKANTQEDKTEAPSAKTESSETSKTASTQTNKTDGEMQNKKALEKAENEIIEAVANELNVSTEAVTQILAQLNMSALELTDMENLGEFMREFYNVDSKVELLGVENVQDTLKALQNTVSDFADEAALFAEQIELNKQAATLTDDAAPETEIQPVNTVELTAATEELAETTIIPAAVQDGKQQETAVLSNNKPEAVPKEAPKDLAPEQVVQNADEGEQAQQQAQQQTQQQPKQEIKTAALNTAPVKTTEILQSTKTAETENLPEGIIANPASLNTATVAETAARQTESLRNINTRDIINQIVEKMKVEVKADNTQEIKITLRPENLGDVSLKITTQNGIVTAHFIAENQRVKEVIEAGFNQLRDSLQEQGVTINQLSVSVGQDDAERRMAQFNEERAKSAGRINRILNGIEGLDGVDGLNGANDISIINENDVYETSLDYSI